jgi:hypothetical protein
MDTSHSTRNAFRTETKADKHHLTDHLTVFREFLNQLDALQRRPPAIKPPRAKARRKPVRRGSG